MKELRGVPASGGIAIGPSFLYEQAHLKFERQSNVNPADELHRLSHALTSAREQLESIYQQTLEETSNEMASIFQFQLLVLDDPDWLELVHTKIETYCINAEAALEEVGDEYIQRLEEIGNEYFRDRAVDIKDITGRIIRNLLHEENHAMGKLEMPSIVIARDLTPSDTVTLDKSLVLGFCIAEGGPTSHTAILARQLGLPAAVGFGKDLLDIQESCSLVLDGSKGLLIVNPDQKDRIHFQSLSEAMKIKALAAREQAHGSACTLDGRRIEVAANIGSIEDAQNGLEFGADGVGLLRTEFLYLERSQLPTEEEQYQIYRNITDLFGEMPVVLRIVDIGGDKEVPYLDLPREANPFLGVRGLRLCLARPDLFEPQLKAVLRVMAERNLKIMFPMVTTLAELRDAKKFLEKCRNELIREGKSVPDHFEIGIMVEVPATAILADQFASSVDFFSIGTNDLSQYVMAADRTNNAVYTLAESFSPAIFRLVHEIVQAAHLHGKWVGMCGELASEPLAIPILLGLGLDELSMNPPAIPLAKQIIRSISIKDAQEIARVSLQLESAQEIKKFAKEKFAEVYL